MSFPPMSEIFPVHKRESSARWPCVVVDHGLIPCDATHGHLLMDVVPLGQQVGTQTALPPARGLGLPS